MVDSKVMKRLKEKSSSSKEFGMVGIGYVEEEVKKLESDLELAKEIIKDLSKTVAHYSSENLSMLGLNKSPCVADDSLDKHKENIKRLLEE